MTGNAEQIKALVRSHAAGDDEAFYAVALQVAAQAARRGHTQFASDLKQSVQKSRQQPVAAKVTAIAQPRGDLAELVIASFPKTGMRDLVLPPEATEQVKLVLSEQRQRQHLLAHGYQPVHKILLEGPPGTGKTLTASVIAKELSLPLLTVRLDAIMSKFLGETASKLRVLFDAASEQRAVYFFDEFDAIGGQRTGNDVGEARRILNSFLMFLEQVQPESVVIAATNHRSILDQAVFRRFDMVLHYGLPDHAAAVATMRLRLGSLAKGIRWGTLQEDTSELSNAELVKAAESAAKKAIMNKDHRLTTDDLRAALRARRAGRLG